MSYTIYSGFIRPGVSRHNFIDGQIRIVFVLWGQRGRGVAGVVAADWRHSQIDIAHMGGTCRGQAGLGRESRGFQWVGLMQQDKMRQGRRKAATAGNHRLSHACHPLRMERDGFRL